jgi:hypothetical protein
MATPPRIESRFVLTMPSTPPKPPLKQIQGQRQIDVFIRPQISPPMNDDIGQRAHTTPLQRKRRIHDSDDDDDCPMTTLTAVEPAGTTADPVLIQDTENESDANFGVYLLPERQQSQEQPSKPSSLKLPRRSTRSQALDNITEEPV